MGLTFNPAAPTFKLKGAWSAATQYIPYDVVLYEGDSWAAKVSNLNVTPVEGVYWTQLTDGGAGGGAGGSDGMTYLLMGA